VVSGLVRLTPSADVADLQAKIAALGGKVRASMTEADLLSVEVPASRLSDLADLPGVSYVEAGERYAPDSTR
jgi:hypothetical protein